MYSEKFQFSQLEVICFFYCLLICLVKEMVSEVYNNLCGNILSEFLFDDMVQVSNENLLWVFTLQERLLVD